MENHSRSHLLDQVLNEELPRYAETLRQCAAHLATRPIDQFGAVTHREHYRATREHIGGSVRVTPDGS